MLHKAEWKEHPMKLECTLAGLPVKLVNHYISETPVKKEWLLSTVIIWL